MTDHHDELLDEIGAALSIEPTPEFAAKVRQEIRTLRPSSFLSPHVWAGATIVVACLAIAVLFVRHETAPLTSRPVPTSAPAMEERYAEGRGGAALGVVPLRRTARPALGKSPQNQVVFAVDEVEAFWRLAAAVQANHLTIPPERWPISDVSGEIEPLPEIAAIELPVVTIDLLPATESDDKVGGTDDE